MQRLYMSKSYGQIQQIRTDLLEAMDADIYEERERYIWREGRMLWDKFSMPLP